MSKKLPETICMIPWISVESTPQGQVRPCCLSDAEILDEDGNTYNLSEHTLEDAYRSKFMQNLRAEFLNGEKPKSCRRCWHVEDSGMSSKRQNTKIRLKEYYDKIDWENTNPDQLWFLDLKLGNICNLKCRICGSWSSSKWAKEEIDKSRDVVDPKLHLAYSHLKTGTWPRENQQFWDNLKELLPNIKYFEFTGGEPFLIDQHFQLLEYAVEQGYSKDIEIHYNTNGTIFPEKHYLWKEFKMVEVAFSVDNTGKRFEYERFGANWDEVNENIKKISELKSDKLRTQLCTTVNIQNVYYLPEIFEWAYKQDFDFIFINMLHDPWYMNIKNIPISVKWNIEDKLFAGKYKELDHKEIKHIVKFLDSNGPGKPREFYDKFYDYMQETDKYRQEKFSDTHPEIAELLDYDKRE